MNKNIIKTTIVALTLLVFAGCGKELKINKIEYKE